MKQVFTLAVLAMVFAGCSSTTELARVNSPDRQGRIVLTAREMHGIWLPAPEPPQTLARWARCVVKVKGRKVYDSGFEDIGVYPFPFDFDVAWAPDSGHVAYRSITDFQILDRQGRLYPVKIPCTNSLISSFKWTSAKDLLLVVKEMSWPLDEARPKNIRIVRLNLDSGFSERYMQSVSQPHFISHSTYSKIQEISPYSDRVAFSDGTAVCVYDDAAGKVAARVPIHASLDGVWWETENKLLLDLGAWYPSEQFFRLDLKDGTMEDCTASLWLLRHRKYKSATWFRPEDGFSQHTEIPWRLVQRFSQSPDEKDLRQWISEKLPARTSLIYHGWSYPSAQTVSEEWLLNCPAGFASLTQQTTNRTVVLVPTIRAFDVAGELYSMGIKLGGKRPSQVWRLDWKTSDTNTDVTGIIYPHADGEMLRIQVDYKKSGLIR